MKQIISILVMLTIASTGFAQSTVSTISAARKLLSEQRVELVSTKDELSKTKTELDTTRTVVLDLNTKIIELGKDRDEKASGWATEITAHNATKVTLDKTALKLSKMSGHVNWVAGFVAVLCGISAFLVIIKFLGSAAWASGPYGAYIIGAITLSASGAGAAAVEIFFRK